MYKKFILAGVLILLAIPAFLFLETKEHFDSNISRQYEIVYLNGDVEKLDIKSYLSLSKDGCVVDNSNKNIRCGVRGFRSL